MEMVKNQKDWLSKAGLFLFGKFLVQNYSHKKLFLIQDALKIKEAVSIPVIYIGGILDGQDVFEVLEKGFDFVQVGRALIHDPDFTQKLKSEIIHEAVCDSCNRCVASMDAGGVFCVSKKLGYLNS
jgi:2,4-dienoyl-CoA reductase-like NADH-dependent reductase (Old Yellow Enzyme family)